MDRSGDPVARRVPLRNRHIVALAVPADVDPATIALELARRLRLDRDAIVVRAVAGGHQRYVIAAWPRMDDPNGLDQLAALAEELGGDLIDGAS